MTSVSSALLEDLMAARQGSIDPSQHLDEVFDLYSIPAFDNGKPDVVVGSQIGSAKQIVEPGSVLLSRIVPHIRRAWVVRDSRSRRIIASGEWIVFRNKRVDAGYLRHVLVGDPFHAEFMQTVSGVGGSLLRARASYVAKIRVPLPPLPEQRRIAKVLDLADALRSKRRDALAQLDTLTQSIFLDMFGDPATNPNGWPIRAVSQFVAGFQGGKSMEAESGEGVVTRNRVLRVSAVTGMRYLSAESKPMPDSYEPPEEHFVRPGDLLFSRANTAQLVGAVAYVEQTPPNVLLPDKLWRFVWREPVSAEPLFVWALFQTTAMRYEISRRATGTSGSMKNISQEKVLGIRTILPPIRVQSEFASRLSMVAMQKASQRSSLTELDALFASLQHRAFRGEL